MTARTPVQEPVFTTLQPLTPSADASGKRTTTHRSSIASSSSPSPSTTTTNSQEHNSTFDDRRIVRNVSPGLLARMKFLDKSRVVSSPTLGQDKIGRIPESQIRELDEFHRERPSIRVQRKGIAWAGVHTPLMPQLTGESVPAMDHSPPPGFESDRSSFISTSDRVLPSDSEQGDALPEDTQKYRLPDLTKTKSLSQPLTEANTGSNSEVEPSRPPTPPPKGTPPLEEASVLDDQNGIDVEAYFRRRHLSRANSIYTLSRVSFTNQIQQLTSIQLPSAASLSSSISAIPTSTAAGRALYDAAGQIKLWMAKASEVLSGLDAEDDVEWAAAAGREGLAEVDASIGRFEGLVTVYITAIEELQSRPDIAVLPAKDLTRIVAQMDEVLTDWQKIKQTLKSIKSQVEIAMEWEELWNTVLGEIGLEIESLSRHVFEMEERRHRAISDSVAESAEKFDIADLETIVEETPRKQAMLNNRFSMPTFAVVSPISPIPQIEKENSRLLSLFAKLQPLRASLDFLPMRLSSFQARASKVFPSACDELVRRKETLEKQEKKLEDDANALREELGEDKWVHSFRQAGSKAIAMYTSLMKSIQKLGQAIDEGDEEKLGSRITTYKDKREHYPPSMKRVLDLIDIEMKHRSTVNGEILRIQQDVRQKMSDLELEIQEMDAILEEFTSNRKLRDSVSTILSSRTEQTTSAFDTPGSSPASSVIMSRKSSEYGPATPGAKSRQSSLSGSKPSLPPSRRYSSLPTSTGGHLPRKSLTVSRLESIPSDPSRAMSNTPTRSTRSVTPGSDKSSAKPRWNSSTNMRETIVGHNFKPLSLTSPSPHRKDQPSTPRTLRSVSSHSAIPVRSPLSRAPTALSPSPSARPTSTTPANQPSTMKRPTANTLQSPSTPSRAKSAMGASPGSGSYFVSGASASSHIAAEETEAESPTARRQSRPASAMHSRRTSLLPQPKQRTVSGSNVAALTGGVHSRLNSITESSYSRTPSLEVGRSSRAGGRKSSLGISQTPDGERPRWK